MIARVWHGRIRVQDADEYVRYIESTGLRDYRSCQICSRFHGDGHCELNGYRVSLLR